MANKITYVSVSPVQVKSIKKQVYSLPKSEQRKYYSLLNKLSNNFYGADKSLNDRELKLYKQLTNSKGFFVFRNKK